MKLIIFILMIVNLFAQDIDNSGMRKILDNKNNIIYSDIFPDKLYPNTNYETNLDSSIESAIYHFNGIYFDWGISGLQLDVIDCYTKFYETFHTDFKKQIPVEEINNIISSKTSEAVLIDTTLNYSSGYAGLTAQPYTIEFYRLFKNIDTNIISKNLQNLLYCSGCDIASHIMDKGASDGFGYPPADFFSYRLVGQRLLSGLSLFGYSEEATFRLLDISMKKTEQKFISVSKTLEKD